MGETVFPGRYTLKENKEDLVVFIIGMRINKWWAVHKWLPVLLAMPPMIKELYKNKELGCLSMENFLRPRTSLLIQYWQSEEHLLAYAKGHKHLKAWADFNQKVGNNDAVGIYHETYIVAGGNYETIYGNMPKFGLGRALGTVPITSATKTAEKRLKKTL
ncbi:hypothetical protein FIU87_04840 [Bacillus sp. THAF10]|uniref:DUF4188 domain-containing protein n=1 Tax=Bacillus sp. THAF10 TaxID=2587848 RepID=UPI0012682E45|nr:DUF4188 domain-containing protein [Bacillus sp. THAF10]QFT87976.1 hypothetical protein FIU87_04840 [Bacillus sp. THAF10]